MEFGDIAQLVQRARDKLSFAACRSFSVCMFHFITLDLLVAIRNMKSSICFLCYAWALIESSTAQVFQYPPPPQEQSYYPANAPQYPGPPQKQYAYPKDFHEDLTSLLTIIADLDDLQNVALKRLDRNSRNLLLNFADDGITKANNQLAYKHLIVKPRAGVDVSYRTLSTNIFGKVTNVPFGIAESYFQKLYHPLGELAMAQAAEAFGTIMVCSIWSSYSIEDIAKAAPNARKWLEIYPANRTLMSDWVYRAEKAYYEAIVIHAIPSFTASRNLDLFSFMFPPGDRPLANFQGPVGQLFLGSFTTGAAALQQLDAVLDPSFSWGELKWLRSITKLKLILKCNFSPADAELALENGVDGIYLSNDGGAQADTMSATVESLPEIVKQVDKRAPVFIDGGITSGHDIFKAMGLGADCVFVEKSAIYGLSVAGKDGVIKALSLLKEDLDLTMAYAGVTYIDDIKPELIGMSRNVCPML